jgi:hypothetical protein
MICAFKRRLPTNLTTQGSHVVDLQKRATAVSASVFRPTPRHGRLMDQRRSQYALRGVDRTIASIDFTVQE